MHVVVWTASFDALGVLRVAILHLLPHEPLTCLDRTTLHANQLAL